jgi:DNA ligase (NAD+)
MNKLLKLKASYLAAKDAYYNKSPLMSDAEFDALEDQIRKLDPKWGELEMTGVKVKGKKVEVKLRQFMPSLNKAYPEDLPKWLAKNPAKKYVASQKLDGTSLQLTYSKGKPTKLVTRGNGELGKDVSFLLPALNLPVTDYQLTVDLRVEAIISKAKYKKWASEFDDPRSMVNGIFNRHTPHPALADVDLIVLGTYGQTLRTVVIPFGGQLRGVGAVVLRSDELSPESMTSLLAGIRKDGVYEVDGLVIAPSTFVLAYRTNDKPKNIVAFKVNADIDAVEVVVDKIIWQITGRSRIVPKIYVKPTKIGGVMVKHAAAHNAKWMIDRGIGPGAVVRVVRSGGVIPKIVEVVKAGTIQLPEVAHKVHGVHFIVRAASATTKEKIEVLNVVKFLKTMGIENIAGSTALALYQAGLREPLDYINAWDGEVIDDFLHQAGFPGAQGKKLARELDAKLSGTHHYRKLMVAFQCFDVGIGDRKLKMIEDAGISMTELSKIPISNLPKKLANVNGYSDKTIALIAKGMPLWRHLLDQAHACGLKATGGLPAKKVADDVPITKYTGLKFSWTGYRSAAEETEVANGGGEVIKLGAKTNVLFYNPDGKFLEKVAKARKSGVECVTFKSFTGEPE